jgi:hypothetical protein
MQVFDDRFQAESGCMSSILTLLGNGYQKIAWNLPMPNVQYRNTDDEQRRCWIHVAFHNRINLVNWCVWLVIKKNKSITMHGNMKLMNVNFWWCFRIFSRNQEHDGIHQTAKWAKENRKCIGQCHWPATAVHSCATRCSWPPWHGLGIRSIGETLQRSTRTTTITVYWKCMEVLTLYW